jgi:multiple antibiotic resistance protein
VPAIQAFLLAFPALFSIVNPIGGAFIFNAATAAGSHAERVQVSKLVGLYALFVLLGALWFGVYILNFFGITLAALRIGGGVAVSISAWELLAAPEQREERKQAQASADRPSIADMAFFPLTMPFTTGPGTIAVAITLGSGRPSQPEAAIRYFLGASAAALVIAAMVWLLYRNADRIGSVMSDAARKTVSRLSAFLLLCIGVQILITGATDVVETFLRDHAAG